MRNAEIPCTCTCKNKGPCHPGGDGNEASDDGNAPAEQNGPLAFLLKPCNRFPGILRVKSEKLHRAAVEQFTKALRADKRSRSIENQRPKKRSCRG